MGYQSLAGKQMQDVENLVRAGKIQAAIDACEECAREWYAEEVDCDQAGDYADGMRASRQGDEFKDRARELRALLAPEP